MFTLPALHTEPAAGEIVRGVSQAAAATSTAPRQPLPEVGGPAGYQLQSARATPPGQGGHAAAPRHRNTPLGLAFFFEQEPRDSNLTAEGPERSSLRGSKQIDSAEPS